MPLTRDQARAIDRWANETLGLPTIVLMENAARGAASVALNLLRDCATPPNAARVVIACAGGNNAGDGYALARQLHNAGVTALTLLACKPITALTGDAATNARACVALGLTITDTPPDDPPDLAIDALLGTGFIGDPDHPTVREPIASAIRTLNAWRDAGTTVLALDLPSGLDCDTGRPATPTVRATHTVTFVDHKQGFAADTATPYLGRVAVASIGVTPPDSADD